MTGRTPSIITALALVSVFLAAGSESAFAQGKQSILVVPFGVSNVDDVKLAAALTESSKSALVERGTTELAQAPLIDILTLVECPEGTRECIGSVADALDVDAALIGRVVSNSSGTVVEVMLIGRDKTIVSLRHVVGKMGLERERHRYHTALAAKLGLTPPAAIVAKAPAAAARTGAATEPPASASQGMPAATVAPTSAEAPTAASESAMATTEPAPLPETPGARFGPDAQEDRGGLSRVRPLSWVTMGSGMLMLGVGTIFYAKAKSTEDEVASAPTQSESDLRALEELEDRGDRQMTTAGVLFVAGAIATTAGLALVVWDSTPDNRNSVAVSPAVTRGGAAMTISGSF